MLILTEENVKQTFLMLTNELIPAQKTYFSVVLIEPYTWKEHQMDFESGEDALLFFLAARKSFSTGVVKLRRNEEVLAIHEQNE